ncbi:hypothetical protein QR680_006663 [Steinernema hermaphroditum]|uniref:DNA2/NAM7 helicase-like C-terminal domain-containing protein n=1 Tax=Steinernema hermaphroditum TaxID=289476 RepID=A0AA39HXQ5_9BILA|nr:hypothetical protein QR680_006663 [Steinernema hermaphroditum]
MDSVPFNFFDAVFESIHFDTIKRAKDLGGNFGSIAADFFQNCHDYYVNVHNGATKGVLVPYYRQGNLPTLSALNDGQKKAAEAFILSNEPVHYVQAPAGTGKTRMIAAMVGCLHSQPHTLAKGIVITATTNNSVLNVLQTLIKESLSTAKIIFIQSDLEGRRTRENGKCPEDVYKVVEYARLLAGSPLVKDPECQLLQHYVEAKEAGIRSILEARAVGLVIRLCRPDIIVATMAMVQAHCKAISPRANYLMIDEAGQVSVAQCAALAATCAKLEKLLITGDIFQLPAYTHRLKGDVLKGGIESVITARKITSLDVRVTTVDGFQGREDEIIIVVTTRTSSITEQGGITRASGSSDEDFLLSDERAVVSLTRAREGLFILRDVNFLMAGDKWATFLRQAATLTYFVTEGRVQLIPRQLIPWTTDHSCDDAVTEDYSKRLAEAGQVDCAQIKAVTSFSSFQKETKHMER